MKSEGSPGGQSGQELGAGAMEKPRLPTYSALRTGLLLNKLSSVTTGHLPRDGHAHSGLGPPKLNY